MSTTGTIFFLAVFSIFAVPIAALTPTEQNALKVRYSKYLRLIMNDLGSWVVYGFSVLYLYGRNVRRMSINIAMHGN
jgi:hypothetical protein